MVHCELIVARNLKLIQSSLVRCCCLETCLACLVGVRCCLVKAVFSHDSIQTSPDESNLKFDVMGTWVPDLPSDIKVQSSKVQ
jgi:hypothetical protein